MESGWDFLHPKRGRSPWTGFVTSCAPASPWADGHGNIRFVASRKFRCDDTVACPLPVTIVFLPEVLLAENISYGLALPRLSGGAAAVESSVLARTERLGGNALISPERCSLLRKRLRDIVRFSVALRRRARQHSVRHKQEDPL